MLSPTGIHFCEVVQLMFGEVYIIYKGHWRRHMNLPLVWMTAPSRRIYDNWSHGFNRSSKTKVFLGGSLAGRMAWPWMVQLETDLFSHMCGATLICSNWVITAAHCFLNFHGNGLEWVSFVMVCTDYSTPLTKELYVISASHFFWNYL